MANVYNDRWTVRAWRVLPYPNGAASGWHQFYEGNSLWLALRHVWHCWRDTSNRSIQFQWRRRP